ncbi:MAG: AAA family ATPase [Blastocatellia bacterium AA13]|nr:MAG: AAA family ATPase [Blastocatellia bacterium AA13]
MNDELRSANAACIENEAAWFCEVLDLRFKLHSGETPRCDPLAELPPPEVDDLESPYARVVSAFNMTAAERLVVILAYLPHTKPDALDPFFIQNQSVQRRFTEFGGLIGLSHSGFLPTAETAMFILAGDDINFRLEYYHLFDADHYLYLSNILRLDHRHTEEPPLSAALHMTAEYVERLTTGRPYNPPFSPEFPAQLIATDYEWSDLVLDAATISEIEDIVAWIKHEDTLMNGWSLKKRLKRGFRSLFYGPPGAGKTLTASLLGKEAGLPVYRIDLSKVVSKYIGETEKNLASLFDHAEHQNWILFFDEADSLFGKRTESRNANDRAANQQVSYLLQRVEDFPGVVILATNLRSNLDEAFARRFQSMIHFPMPGVEQRVRLWEENFLNKPYKLSPDVDLRRLAEQFELSGGSIINVLRYACLKAVVRSPQEITSEDLVFGVRRELHKEGKFLKQASGISG